MMWQKLLKSKKKYIFASIQGMILTGVKEICRRTMDVARDDSRSGPWWLYNIRN